MSDTRLHIRDDLAAGTVVGTTPEQAHYLRSVLRLGPGTTVRLFNGRDGEWSATIDGIGKGWASLAVGENLRPQETGPDLWLLFAPIKRARIDFLLQKAVELGAARLVPVLTRHTNVERVKADRLRANAVEAAEQCERLDVPEVEDPRPLDRVLAGWDSARPIYACLESGAAPPMADVVRNGTAPAAILVGPEGGFSDAELETLRQCPFLLPVGLGPRILRAETAAVAALAVWQALAGDWGGRPFGRN